MTSPLAPSTTATADRRIPAQHPFAGHLRRAADAERAAAHRLWTPGDGPLPSLYLSHGAPMLFEMTDWMTELHSWARAGTSCGSSGQKAAVLIRLGAR